MVPGGGLTQDPPSVRLRIVLSCVAAAVGLLHVHFFFRHLHAVTLFPISPGRVVPMIPILTEAKVLPVLKK